MPRCLPANETKKAFRSIPRRWKGRAALGSAPLSMLSYCGFSTELPPTDPFDLAERSERTAFLLWSFSALLVDGFPSASRGDEELGRRAWKHPECALLAPHTPRLGCPPFARPVPYHPFLSSRNMRNKVSFIASLSGRSRIVLPLTSGSFFPSSGTPHTRTMGPAITPVRQVGRTNVDGVAQLAGIAF